MNCAQMSLRSLFMLCSRKTVHYLQRQLVLNQRSYGHHFQVMLFVNTFSKQISINLLLKYLNVCLFLETIAYCQDLKKSSVLLAIDPSTKDSPLFACRLDDATKAKDIGSKFDGRFTDMRTAIFTLPEERANLISRV